MKRQSQIWHKIIIFFLILTLAQTAGSFVCAAETPPPDGSQYFIKIDQATARKGYTIKAFDGLAKLALPPGVLADSTGVEIKKISPDLIMPWQLDRLSEIFQYEIINKSAYSGKKPLVVEIKYDRQSDYYKQIYFYDKNYLSWRPLPCRDGAGGNSVKCDIGLGFAQLAVFANSDALVVGRASWYQHKKGLFAASPDFPKGSKLKVTSLENGKSVVVEVNDFGPDKALHPDRPIDLEKEAFKKIASLSQGTVKVKVEPLAVAKTGGRLLGLGSQGAKAEPSVTAKSAILMEEASGDILWQNQATSTRPLASLTKLVAIKVFLDTRPSLNEIVAYSVKDEEYNYQYASKAEIARLKIKDRETLTVEDLLYAALVGSANNAVESLVRVSGLVRDDFISKMNQAAAEWGASSTHFLEPTGLSPDNVSSAYDYAIISKQVYANPIIQKASTRRQYKFTTLNTKKAHTINNTDKLLAVGGFNITGSKTGYLDEAQYCLMVRIKSPNGRQIIAVTLGSNTKDNSFDETEELLRWGLKKINGYL
ncbi:MAG: RlpA-like double-psi beta-barrel domain-containing protein [bacterium]|nr:RlpA-like double-psi beta-barrel domain-containing protein [bacterium]